MVVDIVVTILMVLLSLVIGYIFGFSRGLAFMFNGINQAINDKNHDSRWKSGSEGE